MSDVLFDFVIDGEQLILELCDEPDSACSYRALSDGEEWLRVRAPSREQAIQAAAEMRNTLVAQRGTRLRTARHEAAHAIAALHYNIPIELTTLRRQEARVGTTRMAPRDPLTWTVAICCGPLAENGWDEFCGEVHLEGTDEQQVASLGLQFNQRCACEFEAMKFVSDPEVRRQIDRVAEALLERKTLTGDQVRDVAEFGERLCSADWK